MNEKGLQPYFSLHSFQIKPMDAPDPGTRIWVKGYRVKKEENRKWHVDFPSGYHLPFQVDIEAFSGQTWDMLWKVEMGADFGYADLDWEFCADDLDIQFFPLDHQDVNRYGDFQKVIQFA